MAEPLKKQNGVIWLDKTGLSLYIEDKPFIRLNFTPEIIDHLEVIDKIKLETSVHNFVNQNKIGNLSLIMIMTADILFEKSWPIPQTEVQIKEEADFVDSLPFENVAVHSWTKDTQKKIAAVNQDFITVFKESFEKDNCHIVAAFPYSIFTPNIRNESVKDIWKKLDSLKHDNFIEKPKESSDTNKVFELTNPNKKQERSILPFLIPVFLLLMGILAYLLLRK